MPRASAGASEQSVDQRDRGQPQPVDEGVARRPARADGSDRRRIADGCHRCPSLSSAPADRAAREQCGGPRAAPTQSQRHARDDHGGSQSWPSGTRPSSRATANGTRVASEASSPEHHADDRDEPRPRRRPSRGPGPAWRPPAAAGGTRPAVRDAAAKALTTMIAAKTAIIPTTTLLSRLIVSASCVGGEGRGPAVDADQHQDAGRGGGKDHRPGRARRSRCAGGAALSAARWPAHLGPTAGRASTAGACSSTGASGPARARRGSRRAGRLHRRVRVGVCAVTVMVTTPIASP